jgi:hypothetical protein
MYTIFSAVQRQQRKSDVITSFGLTACSAVYYQVPHCRLLIRPKGTWQQTLLHSPPLDIILDTILYLFN